MTQEDPSNYLNTLIDSSDLMISEEELVLFPLVPINSEGSHLYLTEMGSESKELSMKIQREKTEESKSNSDGSSDLEENEEKENTKSIYSEENLWDTDLEEESEHLTAKKDHSNAGTYLDQCTKLDVVPATYYLQNMEKLNLIMKHHGLGPLGTKAMAKSLECNTNITELDLSGNDIQYVGATAIGKMLEENNYIIKINLSDNMINTAGVRNLCKSLLNNPTLKYLDLGGNSIDDEGSSDLSELLEKNKSLIEISLKRNNIGSKGAYLLGAGIASNDVLEVLDLSWNQIRGEGAYSVARGLKENVRIKHCNLSYNGFAKEGGKAIAETLKDNSYLVSLNLEANRFDQEIVELIGKSLAMNETLEQIYLGLNPINTTGVLSMVSSINSFDGSRLDLLSLKDVPVNFEIVKTIEHIRLKRSNFKCIHGLEIRVGNTPEDVAKRMNPTKDPIVLLKEHVLINDKRLIDILQNIDEDKNMYVTTEQFCQAMEELGLPFKKAQVLDLRTRLDKKGNGTIYYGDFIPKLMSKENSDIINAIDESESVDLENNINAESDLNSNVEQNINDDVTESIEENIIEDKELEAIQEEQNEEDARKVEMNEEQEQNVEDEKEVEINEEQEQNVEDKKEVEINQEQEQNIEDCKDINGNIKDNAEYTDQNLEEIHKMDPVQELEKNEMRHELE